MTVGFRLHVARRYLLVARNAEAILAAGITNVMEAERFASRREYVTRRRGVKLRTPASNDVPQAITDRELELFAEVGHLPFDAQAPYLQQLADKLTGTLQP